MTTTEIKASFSSEIWSSYFKFCVEWNPWDRVISAYYHHYNDPKHDAEPRPSLDEYVSSDNLNILKEKGYWSYTIDGSVVVDRIVRYELLDEEMEDIRKHLGIQEPLILPRAKGNFRKDRRHYSEVLSPNERRIVESFFSEEICLMGYQF